MGKPLVKERQMGTKLQYIKSEKELLDRAKSIAKSENSSELMCRITSDMTSKQKKTTLRAARAKAKAFVAKIEAEENNDVQIISVSCQTEYDARAPKVLMA